MKIITEKQTEFTYTAVIVLIVSLSIMRQVGISNDYSESIRKKEAINLTQNRLLVILKSSSSVR
jgi:3-deoxy-D-manno-octulosonic acid (KDO) 8-phosphate synthase